MQGFSSGRAPTLHQAIGEQLMPRSSGQRRYAGDARGTDFHRWLSRPRNTVSLVLVAIAAFASAVALSTWSLPHTMQWPFVWRFAAGVGLLMVSMFVLTYVGLRMLLWLSGPGASAHRQPEAEARDLDADIRDL